MEWLHQRRLAGRGFLEAFRQLGFQDVRYAVRSPDPWRELEGIAFRAVTLVASHPSAGCACC